MPKEYILAHDLGTTGDKATLFNTSGEIIASAFQPYETSYPKEGWSEQDPDDWWEAVIAGTHQIIDQSNISAHQIAVIGFSGMMMGCLPVDAQGNPLRPAIIHSDTRSINQCKRLEKDLGKSKIYQITGNIIDPHYTLSKIPWVKENEPQICNKTHMFLQAKDYMVYKLTGNLGVTDYSDASLSGILDINKKVWSEILVDAAGFSLDKLPRLCPSSEIVGKLTPGAAQLTHLVPGIPVVAGGGDGTCATVGAGAVHPGEAYNYIGGTAWIGTLSAKPAIDPKMRIFNFYDLDPNKNTIVGTMQCAGSSYQWLAEQIGQIEAKEAKAKGLDQFDLLNQLASQAPAGANGLFFLPYLMGERAPIWDPNARGVYFGLTLSHRREELIRAVLEGVAYALKSIIEVIEELGHKFDTIRVIGGGARGAIWRQIIADIYGKKILVPQYLGEATSIGAAIAAGVGVGLFEDFQVAHKLIRITQENTPDPNLVSHYNKFYQFYKSLYPAFKKSFQALSELMQTTR